tara:strand:- start:1479 stop:1715 length:237 start_codon:yes stop_codon:yes gene_type:complete
MPTKKTKKKVTKAEEKKPIVKRGRPPVWGPEKKYNKTIRLSENQERIIYENFPTLQAFFETTYKIFHDTISKKRKKSA